MIVIATNNGYKYLKYSLDSLSKLKCEIPISVIDTISTEKQSIDFINDIKNNCYQNLEISVHQTPYSGYDSGAYIYAMKNFDSERFYFLHDSITIKTMEFFDDIDRKLKEGTVVSLLEFYSNQFDNKEQIRFCVDNIGESKYDKGIFGPMFSILKTDVQKIINFLSFHPKTKNEQMAMERGWSILFKKNNIDIISLCGEYSKVKLTNDTYSYFKKYLPHRNH